MNPREMTPHPNPGAGRSSAAASFAPGSRGAAPGRAGDPNAGDRERRVRFIDASDGNLLGFEICAPADERFARNLSVTLERLGLECLLTKRVRRGRMSVYRYYVVPRNATRLDAAQSLDVRTALLVLIATGEPPRLRSRSGIRAAIPRSTLGNLETIPRRNA